MSTEGDEASDPGTNNMGLGLSDVTETEEGESPFLPRSENIDTLDQEEKEDIDLVKATKDLEKDKLQPAEGSKERVKKKSVEPSTQDRLITKLQNELKKQIDRTISLQDTLRGVQRQLVRIDKTLYSLKREHEAIRKKHAQFNLLQKRVDMIDRSIRTWKLMPKASKKRRKPKVVKKKTKK